MTRIDDRRHARVVPAADVVAHPESHPTLSLLSLSTDSYDDLDAQRRRQVLHLAGSLRRVTEGGAASPGTECRRMHGCLICMRSREAPARHFANFVAVQVPDDEEGLNMVAVSEDASAGSVVMLFTKDQEMLATTVDTIWSTKWPFRFNRRESEQPLLQEAVAAFIVALGFERWVAPPFDLPGRARSSRSEGRVCVQHRPPHGVRRLHASSASVGHAPGDEEGAVGRGTPAAELRHGGRRVRS